MNAQQPIWSGRCYLSSHSGWQRPGIKLTLALLPNHSGSALSDGIEDDVLWDKQHDKYDTDSDEEGDKMYDDMLTHEEIQQMFNEDSDDDEYLGFE